MDFIDQCIEDNLKQLELEQEQPYDLQQEMNELLPYDQLQ